MEISNSVSNLSNPISVNNMKNEQNNLEKNLKDNNLKEKIIEDSNMIEKEEKTLFQKKLGNILDIKV